jgi:hypothetical protein
VFSFSFLCFFYFIWKKPYQSLCDKSHNILSQKQLCHSSLKQHYIQCIY